MSSSDPGERPTVPEPAGDARQYEMGYNVPDCRGGWCPLDLPVEVNGKATHRVIRFAILSDAEACLRRQHSKDGTGIRMRLRAVSASTFDPAIHYLIS